jgi:GT2 family glycosyltransferase
MSTFRESEPPSTATPNLCSPQPRFAVVVTSRCEVSTLRPCLASLASECAEIGAKLIVAHAGQPPNFATLLGAERMALTFVTAPADTSVADLRRIGAQRSGCNVIAFVEDFDRTRIDWIKQLAQGWQAQREIGRVEPPSPAEAESRPAVWPRPRLSVVVPVHNGGATLGRALEALAKTDLPYHLWELVVVDDGSNDDSAIVAAAYADRLVILPFGPHGPGYARNRGFELSLGVNVAFVDADVMVRPETLRRFHDVLARQSDVAAVFGSYDTHPAARNLLSQYHNLLQHHYHQRNAGEASTFWSACGAVRAAVFEEAGGYDEWHFRRGQLEDLELGRRIQELGHRVLLRPEVQVTHLKRWSLGAIIRTEIFDRGVPWMRLVDRAVARTRRQQGSIRSTKTTNIALSSLGALLALSALLSGGPLARNLFAVAATCFSVVVISDSPQFAFFRRERGLAFAASTVVLGMFQYIVSGVAVAFGWIAQHAIGEPRPAPATEAFAELEVKRWPPVPAKRARATPRPMPALTEKDEMEDTREIGEIAAIAQAPETSDVVPEAPMIAIPLIVDTVAEEASVVDIEIPHMLDIPSSIDTNSEMPLQ